MELLGIDNLAERQFDELSAGQHQKVAIARRLVQETEILILDEPTSNLDVRHQLYVTELLRDIARKKSMIIIMICHDLNVAAKYANQVIVMERPGKIRCVGEPHEVFTEELMKEVYGIECRVIEDMGHPHIILRSALPPDGTLLND